MDYMKNVTLDKNYNLLPLQENGSYHDDFLELVDLITKAQSDQVIDEKETSFLLGLLLKREFKNEAKTVLPFARQQEVHSLFMNLKTTHIKHA